MIPGAAPPAPSAKPSARLSGPTERTAPRGGFALARAALVLAGLALLVALTLPRLRHRAFQARLDSALVAVDDARSATLGFRAAEGRWPAPAPPGRMPEGLAAFLEDTTAFQGDAYALELRRWTVLDTATGPAASIPSAGPGAEAPADTTPITGPRPVPLVGLTVHAPDAALLAGLLAAWDTPDAFVRDTTWTLVLPHGTTGTP